MELTTWIADRGVLFDGSVNLVGGKCRGDEFIQRTRAFVDFWESFFGLGVEEIGQSRCFSAAFLERLVGVSGIDRLDGLGVGRLE